MEYTKNYHLPQWVEEDRIQMEDFNDAMVSIENGLDAVKNEAAENHAELGEGLTALSTAVEQSIKFVKLGGPVTTTAVNQTVTFDLGGINMNEYTALLMVAEAAASSGYVSLTVNGSSMLTLCSNNWSQSVAAAWVMPGESKVLGFSQGVYSSSETTNNSGGKGAVELAWSAVRTIGVSGTSYAGMSCTLYGLKG